MRPSWRFRVVQPPGLTSGWSHPQARVSLLMSVQRVLAHSSTWWTLAPNRGSSDGPLQMRLGQPIEYDAASGRVTNCDEAARYLRPEFRKGWTL